LYEADLSALLNALSDFGPRKTTFEETALRAAGPLLWLPGGALTLSTLISHRQERIAEATARTPGFTQLFPGRSQSVNSAYVELRTPLVAAQNRIRGVEELELQLAVRRDEYQVNGATTFILSNNPSPLERAANELSSTDPTLAIRYRPLRDAMFRASFGTGFLPPGVEQLVPTAALPITAQLRDPRRGNELATGVTGFGGGNPDLQPEDSRSWSAGLVLTPRGVPGLRASLDWSRIEKTNNIVSFGPATQALMDRENLFPSRFIRAAPAPGDPFGVGRLIQLDLTSINLAQAEVEAWDAAIDYAPQTERYGTFDLFSTLTWLAHFKTKALPTEPFVDSVGIGSSLVSLSTGSPLRLRASGGVTWSRRGLNLTWQSQYFHHYIASTNAATLLMQGNAGRVPSQVYHDVSATYSFASAAGLAWLANTRLQLGLQNVFNRQPPVDVNFQNTFYSPFGDPRLRSYSLSIRHGF
jgi:outer membrane receptor protein involved in Fe transport